MHATGSEVLTGAVSSDAQDYLLTHTMLRIKDPKRSLAFYQDVLGLVLVKQVDFPDWKFSLYFLASGKTARNRPADQVELTCWMFAQTGMLELTHNWGSESDPTLQMHNGNDAPQGYGHICVSVPDIAAACARFDRLGVPFHKRLGEGGMRDIAFIKDPDGYRYEIVEARLAPAVLQEVSA
jgi:lactoylglutathione lyase